MDECLPPRDGEILEPGVIESAGLLTGRSVDVPAMRSGYLQAIRHRDLVDFASRSDAVIALSHRPGHFLVEGRPVATVAPAAVAPQVRADLDRSHIVGRHRTLTQDPLFAIDQLVEIAIPALSPAVNDTFTAITC